MKLLLLLIVLVQYTFAQNNYLLLDKPGKIKRIRFQLGDELHLKTRQGKIKGKLTSIQAEQIEINGIPIDLKDVRALYIFPSHGFYPLFKEASVKTIEAGTLYFIFGLINGLWFGLKPLVTSGMPLVTASFYASSPIFYRLSYKRYGFAGRKRLHTLNLPF